MAENHNCDKFRLFHLPTSLLKVALFVRRNDLHCTCRASNWFPVHVIYVPETGAVHWKPLVKVLATDMPVEIPNPSMT